MKKRILIAATMVVFLSSFNVSAEATMVDPRAQAYVDQLGGLTGAEMYQIISDVGAKLSICQETEGNCQYYQDILGLLEITATREAK